MLQNLYLNKDSHNIEIIGVAVDHNEPVEDFIHEYGIEFPILIGQSNAYEIMQQLGNSVQTLPYTLVVEPDGVYTSEELSILSNRFPIQITAGSVKSRTGDR